MDNVSPWWNERGTTHSCAWRLLTVTHPAHNGSTNIPTTSSRQPETLGVLGENSYGVEVITSVIVSGGNSALMLFQMSFPQFCFSRTLPGQIKLQHRRGSEHIGGKRCSKQKWFYSFTAAQRLHLHPLGDGAATVLLLTLNLYV